MEQFNTRHEELLGAIARGYCHPENSSKVLDPDLCKSICSEIEALDNKEMKNG